MRRILVVPIGRVDSGILDGIARAIERVFPVTAESGEKIPVPEASYHARRGQFHSTGILQAMKGIDRKGFDAAIGVLDEDLYVPRLNFVFGEADIFSGAAVISLARLRQEFYGLTPDRGLFQERAAKEAVHELGHVFGLDHCPDPSCIMFFSNSIGDTDRKGPGFCGDCQETLGI